MHAKHTIFIGKAVQQIAKLRGGGTALPGLVVEKLDKQFVGRMLGELPLGVVVITGTNGKTTTTKIVSELLTHVGLRVLTNKTGSNFVRGIAATILSEVDKSGKLPHDIAVLELDEAHAVQFIKNAPVDHALILNVMRDQLDRFGEIDYTAKLVRKLALSARKNVVLNRDDPRVAAIADELLHSVHATYFGADPSLHEIFVSDDKLHQSPGEQPLPPKQSHPAIVELAAFDEGSATFRIGNALHETPMQLNGVYNFLNAAGALALCKAIVGNRVTDDAFVAALEGINPAFGRGETLRIGDRDVELILVKNPAGFRLALASFNPADTDVMIAINDNYADGRDMSWLWDVDFSSLQASGVRAVTGIRAYDMALRLQYDSVSFDQVEPDLKRSVKAFLSAADGSHKQRIFCTYTAMLQLRRVLKKYTKLEIMG
jgi:UDP-N-acetylmuramyl tripeptide synthase